jgi:cytochrome c-type protein NapB
MIRVFILACLTASTAAVAAESIATLRGAASPADETAAPRMTPFVDSKTRQVRSYPEQPPLIPHDVDGYRIDLKSNKCLSCHARSRTGESGAPMVSITHFMDRDAQFRASISPRRYFCNQCHVPQRDVKPLVANEFVDIDTVLKRAADRARN